MSVDNKILDESGRDFDIIRDFVNLCRSGNYKSTKGILLRIKKEYPDLTDEEIIKIISPAVRVMLGDQIR